MKENSEQIEYYLHKISESPTFSKSYRNVRLLRYLVQKARKNEDVKEHTIGLELFKSKYKLSQNDGKVRVYMYNLRKKLNEYYENEGSEDAIRIGIKKGQYNVSFHEPVKDKKKRKQRKVNQTAILLFCVIVVIVMVFGLTNRTPNVYCWQPFFEKDAKTTCLVSDHFIFQGNVTDSERVSMRKEGINSETDLNNFMLDVNKTNLKVAPFTFFTKMAPFTIKLLTEWFMVHNRNFDLLIESDFSYENLRDRNLVFIGQHKTMGETKSLFLKNSEMFTYDRSNFWVKTNGEVKTYESGFEQEQRTDYAMVSYFPLEHKTHAFFFASNNDIGTIATVKNFTDKDWLKSFFKNVPADKRYFNALFKVTGVGRTELNCELVQIEWVD